jgi:hypothetical protein
MNRTLNLIAVLISSRFARAYDAVRVTLRATLLLAGCPALQARR